MKPQYKNGNNEQSKSKVWGTYYRNGGLDNVSYNPCLLEDAAVNRNANIDKRMKRSACPVCL